MRVRIRDVDMLGEVLIRKGYTKSGFCRASGISTPMLSQLLKGDRHPSPTMAAKIVSTLGMDYDDIFVIEKTTTRAI